MRILIVSQYFWPEQFRVNDIAEHFSGKGFEVDILTGYPNYPKGKLFENFKENKKKYSHYHGAKVYRVPIWMRRNSNKINLFLNYLSFILSATIFGSFFLRKKKYDIIFTFATSPITVSLVSIFFSKIKSAKSILWVLDLWPNILLELSIIKNKFLYKFLEYIVRKIYLSNDIILAQSKTFIKIINQQIYPKKKKIFYFPAWPENLGRSKTNFIVESETSKKRLNNEKINIVFTGNVGEAQNFDNIFNAAKITKNNKKINWTIVGTGRKLEEIKIKVLKDKIENFKFVDHVPKNEIKQFHDLADILLISLSEGEGLSGTIPGKLQTYLNSKKFILGLIGGESKKIIEETKSGICFDPNDYVGMSNFLVMASKDKNILSLENQVDIDKYLSQNFNKLTILNSLENYFKSLQEYKELKLINNLEKIPFDKNFSLSGLNLAFIGYYNLNHIHLDNNLYLWADGVFAKRFFKNVSKLPGRSLIQNINLPKIIERIYILGNLSEKSKKYLENLYKKEIIHINLPYGEIENIFEKYCKIAFEKTDLVIITLPTPKQEILSQKIREYSQNYKILCVGGAVTMASGEEKQIPEFFENNSLEFLWRLRTDTRRRFYRLIVSFTSYISGLVLLKYNKFKKTLL